MHAIGARKRGQAEIGNHEPLRGLRAVVLAIAVFAILAVFRTFFILFGRARRDHVKAGLQIRQQRIDWERGRDFFVELRRNGHRAGPKLLALLVRDLLQLIGLELALEIAVQHLGCEPPVADAVDRGLHRLGVDADNRDALLADARQDVVPAGHAHRRRAVADVNGQLDLLRREVVLYRRDATADFHLVAFAVLQTFDAKLRALCSNGRGLLIIDGDVICEIDAALGEGFGKLHADARRIQFVVGGVVEHAEAVLVEGLVIGLLYIGVGREREAGLVKPQRRPPLLARGKAFGQDRKRRRLLGRRFGPGIGNVGCGARVPRKGILLAIFLGLDGEIGARELEPSSSIVLVEKRGGRVVARRCAVIFGGARLVAVGEPGLLGITCPLWTRSR